MNSIWKVKGAPSISRGSSRWVCARIRNLLKDAVKFEAHVIDEGLEIAESAVAKG